MTTEIKIMLNQSDKAVLTMKAKGMTDKQTAWHLKRKQRTVEQQIARLKIKYNQPSTIALLILCKEQGAL